MTIRCLALAAACTLLAPAPALAGPTPPAQVAFFGPDELTVECFERLQKALATYDALLAAPAPAAETFRAANAVSNAALPDQQPGELVRQHPDWAKIGARVDGIIALVQYMLKCDVTYHPAFGILSPAEIKLYVAIDKRAALADASPEEMVAGMQRLAALADNPTAKAMVEKYRRTQALGVVNAALPEFLEVMREDHVRLAQANDALARADAEALARRVRALIALGVKGSTALTISDDPLSPVTATLDTILATATRRAAGQPPTDPASVAARGVKLEPEDYAARVRAFKYRQTRGKPKAAAVLAEHGMPTTWQSGPNGTVVWIYRYNRNNLDFKRLVTLSEKDGALLSVRELLD